MSKRWNNQEIEFLKNNYDDMDDEYISKALKKNQKSILKKRLRLNLLKSQDKAQYRRLLNPDYQKERRWKDWEVKILKENYKNKSSKEMSILVNKSISQVRDKLMRLYLRLDKKELFKRKSEW